MAINTPQELEDAVVKAESGMKLRTKDVVRVKVLVGEKWHYIEEVELRTFTDPEGNTNVITLVAREQ